MNRKAFWGRLALWGTAFLWGTSFVIIKSTLSSFSVLWLLALRFLVAAALFALFAGPRLKTLDRRTLLGSVLMGLSLTAAYLFQTYGLVYTTPGKNAFLTATYCVLVPFLAWAVYRRRPKGFHVAASVLCLTGVGLVSLDGFDGGGLRGDMLTLVCGLFYALQIIVMEHYLSGGQSSAAAVSAVQFGVCALVFLFLALLFEPFPAAAPLPAWLSLVYLGAVVTGLCFYLQAVGLSVTPSATASVILVFESVLGALTSLLFYGEKLSARLGLGFVLIFLSVPLAEAGEELLGKLRRRGAAPASSRARGSTRR